MDIKFENTASEKYNNMYNFFSTGSKPIVGLYFAAL
jgi:hypothetical protein